MEIEIEKIVNGEMDGKYVYVCDYRSSKGSKPIRHVKPQRVLVRCNSDLDRYTRVYYSESHFIGLNKKDEPLKSKVIKPFDSTGYRNYTGTPVRVFDNMEECQKQYEEFNEIINPKPKINYMMVWDNAEESAIEQNVINDLRNDSICTDDYPVITLTKSGKICGYKHCKSIEQWNKDNNPVT